MRRRGRIDTDRLLLELKRATAPTLLMILIAIAGVLATAGIVRNLAGAKPWEDYVTYRIGFDSLKGVVPGRVELRIAGVKAGAVSDTKVIDGKAVLEAKVEKEHAPLYRDAVAEVRPVTPLEDLYVDIISRGHKRAGELKGDEILDAENTSEPVEVGRILNTFQPDTREHLGTLLNELARGAKDNGDRLRAAFVALAPFLRSTERMTDALADRRRSLARVVHNLSGLMDVLGTRDRQVGQFVRGAQETLTELAANDAPLDQTLREMPPMLASLETSFARLRGATDHLDPALRQLEPTAEQLPDGLDALKDFSDDARPALVRLRKPIRSLRPLARTLKPTSRDLTRSLAPFKRAAPQLDNMTKIGVPCRPHIGKFLARTVSLLKYGFRGFQRGSFTVGARANVRADFNSFSNVLQDPNWKLNKPCFMGKVDYRGEGIMK